MKFSSLPSRLAAVAAAMALFILGTPAHALLVQPLVIEMQSSGSRTNTSLRVVNDRTVPMTIEVNVNRLIVPENGPVSVEPIDGDDFLIFPPQATVAPGATQIFRVRWVGEPVIEQSQLFMFQTEELPVERTLEGGAAIQVLYAIQSVVAVAPPRGRADIGVESAVRETAADGRTGARVMFTNDGNSHVFLSGGRMTISNGAGWRRVLEGAELNEVIGLGLLPPAARRSMFVAIPDLPAEGTLEVTIQPGGRQAR